MRLLKSAIIGAALSTLAISGATTAFAAVVVQNGGFESNPSSIGQVNTTNLPDWSATAAVTGSSTYGWIFQYATGSNGTFGLYNSTTTPGSTGPIAAPSRRRRNLLLRRGCDLQSYQTQSVPHWTEGRPRVCRDVRLGGGAADYL